MIDLLQRRTFATSAPARTLTVSGEPATPMPPQPRTRKRPKLSPSAQVVLVTAIEVAGIFFWLLLADLGHDWWALAALVAGELIETTLFRTVFPKASERWGPLVPDPAAPNHHKKVDRTTLTAGYAEVAIWLAWLWSTQIDQPQLAGVPLGSAVLLLVIMHLKHQAEVSAVCDTPFRSGLLQLDRLIPSAAEVAGAVACLALIEADKEILAAAALFAGILFEHAIQIRRLRWEMVVRDVRIPRDPRWRPPSPGGDRLRLFFSRHARFWRLVERIGPLRRVLNRVLIGRLAMRMPPRPGPLSTMADYTSWPSLTDRSYSARHLPPVPRDAQRPSTAASSGYVAELFARGPQMTPCPKSTVLFAFFAEWFTNGFLRSQRPKDGDEDRDTSRNLSPHDIDLAQLYGFNVAATNALKDSNGLLKCQYIRGEMFPPHLCEPGSPEPKEEFRDLPLPIGFWKLRQEEKDRLFALGTDIANVGALAFNVLFLRAHNRLAAEIAAENPQWSGEQVFQTTRNVLVAVLLQVTVSEYINHITPNILRFAVPAPATFRKAQWYRQNWMAIEFNLLYRWHGLVPSTFHLNGTPHPVDALVHDNRILTDAGLRTFMAAASSQRAGRIGLFNTDAAILKAEQASIHQARKVRLASYNDYRRLCGMRPAMTWEEISSDPRVQAGLSDVYGEPENVEFYVGLFAEDTLENGILPPLMTAMVACDAFSQALTNPLLAPRVFTEQTFSRAGMKFIAGTKTIAGLMSYVDESASDDLLSFTRHDLTPR